jgi:bacterioferritin
VVADLRSLMSRQRRPSPLDFNLPTRQPTVATRIRKHVEPEIAEVSVSREELIDALNEDLSREYQAIIAYVVYSQAIKGAEYMKIAAELELHATQELQHALIIAKQVDYLGGEINAVPKTVKTSDDVREMLRFDLENERETILQYRQRVNQCEALGEYAMAEHIREILLHEQDHLIDLATALGETPPALNGGTIRRRK